MKTIREHLENLPEPHRSQALANLQRQDPESASALYLIESEAVNMAFWWVDTPEGAEYWRDLYNQLKQQGK